MAGFRFNTYNITAARSPYLITAAMNIRVVSFKMSSDTNDAATMTGNLTIKNASGTDQASEALAIGAGEGDTIISGSPAQPIDGISFTVTQGTLRLQLGQ